jgi:hypothetical protein
LHPAQWRGSVQLHSRARGVVPKLCRHDRHALRQCHLELCQRRLQLLGHSTVSFRRGRPHPPIQFPLPTATASARPKAMASNRPSPLLPPTRAACSSTSAPPER